MWLTVIGVVTTVVSFYYYLYVIVQMYMREPAEEFSDVPVTGSVKLALLIAVGWNALPGDPADASSGLDCQRRPQRAALRAGHNSDGCLNYLNSNEFR